VNILVADDSVTMRRIFELTFAGEDAKLICVDSGDAAIARASELSPEVVFVDSSMATDGYKVANAIKSTPGLERTAVILLASQKSPYDEAKGKAAGVDDHVVKPFDTQHLIDKFKRVLAQPRAAAQKPAGAAPQAAGARTGRGTVAFEKQGPAAPAPAPFQAAPPQATSAARPPQQPPARPPASPGGTMMGTAGGAAALASAVPAVAAATIASAGDLAKKLDRLGLSPDQIDGVLALSREVIEKVVWEVVPDLAETLIREEIRRLTQ
jgi:CheY-like chemotaxis protein